MREPIQISIIASGNILQMHKTPIIFYINHNWYKFLSLADFTNMHAKNFLIFKTTNS